MSIAATPWRVKPQVKKRFLDNDTGHHPLSATWVDSVEGVNEVKESKPYVWQMVKEAVDALGSPTAFLLRRLVH